MPLCLQALPGMEMSPVLMLTFLCLVFPRALVPKAPRRSREAPWRPPEADVKEVEAPQHVQSADHTSSRFQPMTGERRHVCFAPHAL